MTRIVFVGGGNMASAIISGLLKQGHRVDLLRVLEPDNLQRERLLAEFGVASQPAGDAGLASAELVVWAVKPQVFSAAAAPIAPHLHVALHLSVMAGIRIETMQRALGTERIVRAMPNMPALMGLGISGLYAPAAVKGEERRRVEQMLSATGATLWFEHERDLDAVTAISGSGPAYVFYFIEAMVQAAQEMGLSAAQGRLLALSTFAGATALVQASSESPSILRDRVTSKGGTTHAAVSLLEERGVKAAFIGAIRAAQQRAGELGDEFGALGPAP